jgi:F0F1-type ATP synthase epsilon subunit
MAALTLSLRTPLKNVFEGEVDAVRLKTDLGRMEILPGHATLAATILYSRVYVRQGGTEQQYIIRQATVSVSEDGSVRITALDAQEQDSIQVESVEQYLVHLNQQLNGEEELNEYQKQFLSEQRAALEETLASMK